MLNRIKNLVDMYFDDLPYSENAVKARSAIENALIEKFDELREGKTDEQAFDALVQGYGKLCDMAALAGYDADESESLRATDDVKRFGATKNDIRKQRSKIYGIALLGVGASVELFWFVYALINAPIQSVFVLLIAAGLGVGAFFLLRSFVRRERACVSEKYDRRSFEYLRDLADMYVKRRLNGAIVACIAVGAFLVYVMVIMLFGHSKPAEASELLLSNMLWLEFPIFILIKNRLCFDMIQRRIKTADKRRFYKHFIGVTCFSAGYWVIVATLVGTLRNRLGYPFNVFMVAGAIFAVFYAVYVFVWRKRVTVKNIAVNRRRAAVVTTAAVVGVGFFAMQRDTWYTQTYINSVAAVEHTAHDISYDDDSGVYTITSATDDFKILHLTDIHLGGSLFSYGKDLKALTAVYAEIEYTKPDLVIVTGDLCFPLGIISLSFNNSAPIGQFAAFMRNIGIPWAFTYGNHDTESMASASQEDMNEIFKTLSFKTSGTLLYPYVQPPVTGRNNQLIELRRADGSFNTALFLIDSNAYTGNGINDYDYIHDDQVEWYKQNVERLNAREARTVDSMAFFHIPLQEYRTAYELYVAGSDEVKYFFGRNDEKMINKVCCSDYPSKLFDTMVELNSTKAVFCGHDHYNNMSLEYRGIRLTYGMSIDYLAMPGIEGDTAQRGAELITIHDDGSFDLVQIPLDSIVSG